jgi:lysophospholipase L1-like esterase
MKKITIAIVTLALISVLGVTAQPPAASNTPITNSAATASTALRANTAIIPKLSAGFMAKHQTNVAVAKKGDIDVLFMGDSITDFWRNAPRAGVTNDAAPYAGKAVFDKYFGALKVANFGIAGDTTQGVIWRLMNGEGEGFQPKAIMLMIGTNNTGRNSAQEIAIGVADIIFELRKDFPDAKILLLGIFPRNSGGKTSVAEIPEINTIISALNDNEHVFYQDIGSKFLGADGTIPRDIMSDGLHPTSKGYEIWAEAVNDTLTGFLK